MRTIIDGINNISNRITFNSIVATLGTLLTWLFGSWDLALKVLVSFMVIDYLTGVIVAYINQEIDSKVGFVGLLKKALILVILTVSVLLDRLIGQGWVFRTVTVYFFVANEGISILENVSKTGLPLPEKLLGALSQLKNEERGNVNV